MAKSSIKEAIQRMRSKGEVASAALGSEFNEMLVERIVKKVEDIMSSGSEELMRTLAEEFLTQEMVTRLKPVLKGEDGRSIVGPRGAQGDSIQGPVGPIGPRGPMGRIDVEEVITAVLKRLPPPPKDGIDGSPDTGKEIVAKLQKLKGNDRLDKSAIKGLEDIEKGVSKILQDFRSSMSGQKGGGGGGMGKVLDETFAVTSATTSINLSNPIMGGFAIWLDYNGSTLARPQHFSVGSNRKTIALNFTPNSSFIHAIYIRG